MWDYIFDRLKEASTWRGVVALLTALGLAFTDVQAEAIITLGLALIGAIGAFFKDRSD